MDVWSFLMELQQEDCRISGRIRTEMINLWISVRKSRKLQQEKCRISGRIRTEMGKMRPSVRKSRGLQQEECQIRTPGSIAGNIAGNTPGNTADPCRDLNRKSRKRWKFIGRKRKVDHSITDSLKNTEAPYDQSNGVE